MTPTPELKSAQNLTSADYLAERVKEAYQAFGSENIADVESLYTTDIYFEDPSHAIQGKPSLMRYFANQFKNLDKCSFKFHSTIANETDIFMTWTMFVNHSKLRGGETIRVEGTSYLRTRNGKIYYHRDYFDMGAMLYEHLPLIGRIIQRIKQRLGQ
ncbi:MAG: nuclear transport factor 2 family protein [Pseudomonadales bacterium]|jgi:predicted SnoaL-like aldol condensation-catalyzing enzyme|nr:nuclear transport factor 2 family protein [Pseudomonadales bacterium]